VVGYPDFGRRLTVGLDYAFSHRASGS
jgi:hypothetical protein